MDAIKTYIDNVFSAFPKTERVQALKREMLTGMEEKYHMLKQEGKSEHEAVGGVIANFGSIDEIAAELGIDKNTGEQDDGIDLSQEETREFIKLTQNSGRGIAFGVFLILIGVAVLVAITLTARASGENFNAVGVFALLLTVAAAVPIFIINGLRLEKFEHYEQKTIRLDQATRHELKQGKAKFMPNFITRISVGVGIIILAVGVVVFSSTAGFVIPAVIGLLLTVGVAVFMFITAGMTYGAYEVLLGEGEYSNKARNKKAEKIIGTVASMYWPTMTAAYLLWSFVGNAWHISWVIWPVAGVLFGAIAGGLSVWLYADEK